MSTREFLMDFPDDHGATLAAMVAALPASVRTKLVGRPLDGFRLRLGNPTDALYLFMAVPGVESSTTMPIMVGDELFVPTAARASCEAFLTDCGSSSARWTTLETICGPATAVRIWLTLWKRKVRRLPR